MSNSRPVIVSACLLGLKTRYDGAHARSEAVKQYLNGRTIIPVCPEQLGGLCTPRPRAWIEKGNGPDVLAATSRVIDANGTDVTERFKAGAEAVLQIAQLVGADAACLKDKSPSCGVNHIYNGEDLVKGLGVTAAALEAAGVKVKGF